MLVSAAETALRLAAAAGLGGLLGVERQFHGHWAGLRTHMTVSMAAAVFVMAAAATTQGQQQDVTRVIQGIAAGVGFLGAGAILKLSGEVEVKGLTTASSIWLAAALGTAAGLALYELAVAATIVSLIVLALLRPLSKRLDHRGDR
jgi:putative Mg2+ transporter-C (MgtC) family protein